MLGLDSRAARYTWTAISIILLPALLYLARTTILVFVIAILFAYLLSPLVNFFDRRLPGRSKIPALAIVYLFLVVSLIVGGIVVGTRATSEANALIKKLPEILSKIESPPPTDPSDHFGNVKQRALAIARDQIKSHSEQLKALLPKAAVGVLTHAEVVLFIVIVPIMSFIFLKDGRKILNGVLAFVAESSYQQTAAAILADTHVLLAQYMRALVILALITLVVYSLFLLSIGAPYAVLLGAIAAPLEFIPMLGPMTAAAVILLVQALSGSGHLLWIVIFLIVYRLLQDYGLQPYLMSAGMQLPPLLVIFGVMAGGELAGIAGSFLSVPVLAIGRIIYRQFRARREPVCEERATERIHH
ncbi:MAG: AI-2E family transporter [Acidobacteria bacterium]|nr:AI-2E family transporter [Acidobacteriota bacterium]